MSALPSPPSPPSCPRGGRPTVVRRTHIVDAPHRPTSPFDLPAAPARALRRPVAPPSSSPDAGKNKFVHLALHRTLTLAAERRSAGTLQNALGHGLDITIVGDNDFYSQRAQVRVPSSLSFTRRRILNVNGLHASARAQLEARNLPPTLASLSALPPFLPTGAPLAAVHKTGLGSSAALITSLTAALLLRLGVVPTSSFAPTPSGVQSEGRKLAHNLAQYVHCLAQGKVGSGFDVASAVFGSQVYTRFDPRVLQPLMEGHLVRLRAHYCSRRAFWVCQS